jgi:LPS export ABC transporter protein LptC
MINAFPCSIARIILTVTCSCIFMFSGCVNDEAKVKELLSKRLGVDEAHNVEAYMSSTGVMKARLRAPLMLRFQDTLAKVEFPQTMHVDFFNDSINIESQLDARYGEYFETKNKVFLKDSVKVFNNTGDTLYCQELWWDQNQSKFYTDKPVRIHRPDMIMIGVGLSAPQDFKTFEIYKISNSILRVKDNMLGTDSVGTTDSSVTARPALDSLRMARRVTDSAKKN